MRDMAPPDVRGVGPGTRRADDRPAPHLRLSARSTLGGSSAGPEAGRTIDLVTRSAPDSLRRMLKLLLAAHLVLAVFAVGPLVHAATTAARGVRTGDGVATASASRVLRIYSYVSVLVVLAGMALMSQKRNGHTLGEFEDAWIWVSLVLYLVAVALVLAVIVPTLDKATKQVAEQQSVVTLTARVAGSGGVVALLF